MASRDQLKALIRSHFEQNEAQFMSVAMQVAASEARRGHGKLAEELREMIDAAKSVPRELTPLDRAPTFISRPRGELASLITAYQPSQRMSAMVVADDIRERLMRIIREQMHFAQLREHGLSPRRKVLLVGPPGTGKTLTASVMAGELHLPLFQVRLDGLISKFMGETAVKLRLIFDSVRSTRAVYFFDEFDAIASQRGLGNDVGEIRRVLNSFLQLIEQDESNSVIVAATNHPEILDYAVFRRFDDIIEYELPGPEQVVETLKARIGEKASAGFDWATLATAAQGLSYADLTRAADEAVKESIIGDKEHVMPTDLVRGLNERRRIHRRQQKGSPEPGTTSDQ